MNAKLTNIIKGNLAIIRAAIQRGIPYKEVRKDIQETLDEAWNETWAPGNLLAQVKWQRLFPGARKPTVEEFIIRLGDELQKQN